MKYGLAPGGFIMKSQLGGLKRRERKEEPLFRVNPTQIEIVVIFVSHSLFCSASVDRERGLLWSS